MTQAGVAELVDAPDLGSGDFGRRGSSPFARTKSPGGTTRKAQKGASGIDSGMRREDDEIVLPMEVPMEVTETSAEGLKRQYKVVVSAAEIAAEYENRLRELGRKVEVKGFRKGHVPPAVVRQRFGASAMGDVLEKAVAKSSNKIMQDNSLRPALRPKIEVTKFAEGADLEYTMALEVLPEIEPADFGRIELTRYTIEVGDQEVEDTLKRLAEQEKLFEPVAEPRAAAKGDALVIGFEGFLGDRPIEGGKAESIELELGSGQLIPGFEDQLVGAKPGEHVTVHVSFPKDYPVAELVGKLARFEVDVKELKARKAVAIDAAFAKRRGLDDLDALRAALKRQLEADYAEPARARTKRVLFDRLVEQHDFELPQGMVEHEFEHAWEHLTEDLKRAGKSFADLGKPEEALRADCRRMAERRVRLGLLLGEIGRRHNIEVEHNALLRAAATSAMRQFPGQERQILEYYRKNPEALEQFRPALFEDKVVDFILGAAKVRDEKVTPEAFVKLAPEGEAAGAAQADGGAMKKDKAKSEAKAKKAKASGKRGAAGAAEGNA